MAGEEEAEAGLEVGGGGEEEVEEVEEEASLLPPLRLTLPTPPGTRWPTTSASTLWMLWSRRPRARSARAAGGGESQSRSSNSSGSDDDEGASSSLLFPLYSVLRRVVETIEVTAATDLLTLKLPRKAPKARARGIGPGRAEEARARGRWRRRLRRGGIETKESRRREGSL